MVAVEESHRCSVILSGALAQSKNPLGKPLTQWDPSTSFRVTMLA